MQDLDLHLHFVTLYERNYSRSGNLLSGFSGLGVNTSFSVISGRFLSRFKQISSMVTNQRENTVFVVMSPAHLLTIYLKLAKAKKVILDAGWSLTEAEYSRGATRRIPQVCKALLVDFLSFMCANLVLVESNVEAKFLINIYRKLKEKIIVTYTGVSEPDLGITPMCPQELVSFPRDSRFILFRGKINNEAGLQKILDIGSALRASGFLLVIASPNIDISSMNAENVIAIDRWIQQSEINYLYLNSIVVIGQLGSIPRLDRTIPHKYFEAIYFGRPYISKLTRSLEEISQGGKGVIELVSQTEQNLAGKISEILQDHSLLTRKGTEARQIWDSGVSSERIAKKLISEEKFKLLINQP